MLIHGLCDNYIPVDAAKGSCAISGQPVVFDGESCGNFIAAPHCLNCKHFLDVKTSELGECSGFGKVAWVYPTMRARNCEKYVNCKNI
ncbi:MAG: 4-hydroxyphenylacetate decarboxylase small subunit [Negativicutes bacterium]